MDSQEADQVLMAVGLGRWQLPHFLGFLLIQVVRALHKVGSPLLNAPMAFHCFPSDDYCNTTDIRYDSRCLEEGEWQDSAGLTPNSLPGPPSCPRVQYDRSIFQATVTSQWHLICEREDLRPMFQLTFSLGSVIGNIIGGQLGDGLGRRTTLKLGCLLVLPACLTMVFIPSYVAVLAMRLILGMATALSVVTGFTLVMEVCPSQYNAQVALSTSMLYGVAIATFGCVGYFLTSWDFLVLSCIIPSIIVIPFTFIMSKSPRWLAQRGRIQEAGDVLRRAIDLNHTDLPPSQRDQVFSSFHRQQPLQPTVGGSIEASGDNKSGKRWCAGEEVRQCVRSPAMQIIFLATPVLAFAQQLLLMGVTLNANNFTSTSPHQYVVGIGLSHLMSSFVAMGLSRSVGRRVVVSGGLMVAGLLLLLNLLVSEDYWWVKWVLTMMAYCLAAAVYELNYVYFVELMPTVIRTRGTTFMGIFGNLGELCAPFITDILAQHVVWAPTLTFSLAGIVGGLCALPLPETRNTPLPETIQDAEDRRKQHKERRAPAAENTKRKHTEGDGISGYRLEF